MSVDNEGFHYGVMSTLSTIDSDAKYFPIVLESINQINSWNSWKLEFQTEPVTQIIFTGQIVPTTESIVKVLSFLPNTPVWMIDVVRAIIGDKLLQRSGKSG